MIIVMFDVDVFDGDGNELFNDYVMFHWAMSIWVLMMIHLESGYRRYSPQYPADVEDELPGDISKLMMSPRKVLRDPSKGLTSYQRHELGFRRR